MVELFPVILRGATARRRGKTIVGPIDLELGDHGTVVVIGPNGSGKTSLLSMLHGTARLSHGEIRWACSVNNAHAAQAFVFQRPVMLRRSVLDNIAYPLWVRHVPKSKAQSQAEEWAERIGLSEMLDRPAQVLSGGEQQKLAVARSLITSPKLLFLDEPCAALDGRSMREIEDLLQEAKSAGTRLMLATHDMGQARRLADEVLFMLGGVVHERGSGVEFFTRPQTLAARAFLNGDIVE